VIGGECLQFAWLARRELGPHAYFGAPAAGVTRGKHKFTRNVSDRHV
jgi:hypothetical protein